MNYPLETTCPYCGVGCGVTANQSNEQVLEISASLTHPANRGKLCNKGSHLAVTMGVSGRLRGPEIAGAPASWEEAVSVVAGTFNDVINQYGPQAVAFYLSGQLLTEDYYVANKLMKGFIGSANVDTNSRLCMASAVAAHKRAFGEDLVPCIYDDLDECDLLILVGSNAAWAHPVLYQRIAQTKQARGTKVVVIDPRRTSTCDLADLHLAIEPGADTALFNGLLTYLATTGHINNAYIAQHTEGFEAAITAARITVADVAVFSGLSESNVLAFYQLFDTYKNSVTMFSQGINQSSSGTDKANAIINCHLATGRIGKPGQGPFSITGQPNAMGGREVGGMANQLAAHMDFNAEDIDRVKRFWGAPNIAESPGYKAVDMFNAMAAGEIKAIWIMGTNPAVSMPDSNFVRAALDKCPFVVVSDCVRDTDTNKYSNVIFPAQGWGEKEGTVTNSERCISRQRRVVAPLEGSKPDWQIVCDVACAMGFERGFSYSGPVDIFKEHARLSGFENSGVRLFNISSLSELTDKEYECLTPTYWPMQRRVFEEGRFSTDNGKARFVATAIKRPRQYTSDAYPLILNTGRSRDHWHTMTRTGSAHKLFAHSFAPTLAIHPEDAVQRNIRDGDLIEVTGRRGHLRLLADVNADTPQGVLFAPIHWSDQYSSRANVAQLFERVTDPESGQPESKHAAVECARVDVASWVRLVIAEPLEAGGLNYVPGLKFWAGSPAQVGWQYEVATDDSDTFLALLNCAERACFTDGQGGQRVLGRIADRSVWLFTRASTRQALPSLNQMSANFSSLLPDWEKLSQCATMKIARDTSPLICNCHEVRKDAIHARIKAGDLSLQALGESLHCGTNCGSCVPEIYRLLLAAPEHAQEDTRA